MYSNCKLYLQDSLLEVKVMIRFHRFWDKGSPDGYPGQGIPTYGITQYQTSKLQLLNLMRSVILIEGCYIWPLGENYSFETSSGQISSKLTYIFWTIVTVRNLNLEFILRSAFLLDLCLIKDLWVKLSLNLARTSLVWNKSLWTNLNFIPPIKIILLGSRCLWYCWKGY